MKLRFLPLSITLALALPLLSSCNAFLSENPDSNLVDPATPTQVQKLLIGAYPTSSIVTMLSPCRMRSYNGLPP